MMGYVKSCTNEIIIQVLSEILGLEDEDEEQKLSWSGINVICQKKRKY